MINLSPTHRLTPKPLIVINEAVVVILILFQSGCQFRSMDSFSGIASNRHHHDDSHERSVTHVNNSAISRVRQ